MRVAPPASRKINGSDQRYCNEHTPDKKLKLKEPSLLHGIEGIHSADSVSSIMVVNH
jgi:hypothetical protein